MALIPISIVKRLPDGSFTDPDVQWINSEHILEVHPAGLRGIGANIYMDYKAPCSTWEPDAEQTWDDEPLASYRVQESSLEIASMANGKEPWWS